MAPRTRIFPRNFVWGVATAAPQVEGAAFSDGKGESIWDRYSRIPGKVLNGDTLDVACDHYNRFGEDFALMRSLGIRNYRLSIAWPRIYPKGDGALNQAGLDFYHRLFDSMAENGITPWVTLFHWDLPQALEDQGGWTARATVDAFATYADTVVRRLRRQGQELDHPERDPMLHGDRLRRRLPTRRPAGERLASVVNQTVPPRPALPRARRARRARAWRQGRPCRPDGQPATWPSRSRRPRADIAAAAEWFEQTNLDVLDPVYRGSYSEEFLRRAGRDAPKVKPGDFKLISLPTDFLGLNIYTGFFVRAGESGRHEVLALPHNYPRADSRWLSIVPQAIYWGARFAHETYKAPAIYVTENGCGYDLEPVVRGEVHRPPPPRVPAQLPRGASPGDRRQGPGEGLLPLVLHGQLRVGGRLHPEVWDRPRRFRHSEADTEALGALLFRGDAD